MKDKGGIPPLSSMSEKTEFMLAFLEGQKAMDPVCLRLDGENIFAECLLIVTASSKRHAQGLADGIARLCQEKGFEFRGMEGYSMAEWILLDCGDLVVNVFQEDCRNAYRLEDLWSRRAQISSVSSEVPD